MIEDKELREAIENLSAKRSAISEEALKAKHVRDEQTGGMIPPGQQSQFNKNTLLIESFNRSVTHLGLIFKKSHFDELALTLSNPVKLLTYQFFIGFMRGLGFVMAILIILRLVSNQGLLPF